MWKICVPSCCFSAPYCKGLWKVCEFWKDFSARTLWRVKVNISSLMLFVSLAVPGVVATSRWMSAKATWKRSKKMGATMCRMSAACCWETRELVSDCVRWFLEGTHSFLFVVKLLSLTMSRKWAKRGVKLCPVFFIFKNSACVFAILVFSITFNTFWKRLLPEQLLQGEKANL